MENNLRYFIRHKGDALTEVTLFASLCRAYTMVQRFETNYLKVRELDLNTRKVRKIYDYDVLSGIRTNLEISEILKVLKETGVRKTLAIFGLNMFKEDPWIILTRKNNMRIHTSFEYKKV